MERRRWAAAAAVSAAAAVQHDHSQLNMCRLRRSSTSPQQTALLQQMQAPVVGAQAPTYCRAATQTGTSLTALCGPGLICSTAASCSFAIAFLVLARGHLAAAGPVVQGCVVHKWCCFAAAPLLCWSPHPPFAASLPCYCNYRVLLHSTWQFPHAAAVARCGVAFGVGSGGAGCGSFFRGFCAWFGARCCPVDGV